MQIKVWISAGVALVLLTLFTVMATAQQATPTGSNGNPAVAQIQPITAVITQQVPLSLTVRISGSTGVQTITVPVLLNLNLQIGLARPLSAGLGIMVVAVQPQASITPTVRLETPIPATPTAPAATATPTTNPPTATAPTLPLTSTPTLTATVTPTATATPTRPAVVAPVCPSPGTVITSPGVNQVVSGTVPIRGIAEETNFDYYKLEYAVGANANEASEYRYFAGGREPVDHSVLGAFDSLALPNRAYTLRLTVVDKTGNFPPTCQVTVLVQN